MFFLLFEEGGGSFRKRYKLGLIMFKNINIKFSHRKSKAKPNEITKLTKGIDLCLLAIFIIGDEK